MKVDFDIQGFEQLEKQLEKVADQTRGKTLRNALRKAAKPSQRDIENKVTTYFDSQTGQLSESIKIKTDLNKKNSSKKDYDAAAFVGVYRNKKAQTLSGAALDAPVYAYWLEYGVQPHAINGKNSTVSTIMHPGIQAKPFIRPTLDENEAKTIDIARTELAKGIERAIKRQSK